MASVITRDSSNQDGAAWNSDGSACVVCVGNELARDDGVGIRVGRVLRALSLPDRITVSFYQELGLGLVELLASGERIVIVDAMTTGVKPGTCKVIDAEQLACSTRGLMACHAFGMAEMLAIASELDGSGRLANVQLMGIEVEDVTGFGAELSPVVALALRDAVAQVLAILGAPTWLIQEGRDLASRAPRELPLAELHAG